MSSYIKPRIKYKPITFFITTFTATWLCWLISATIIEQQSIKIIFMLLGLLLPFLTALCLIFSSKNQEIKKIFFNKLLNIRLIALDSIPAIICIPITSIILAIIISLFFGFSADQFTISNSFSFKIGNVPTLLVLFLAACLEELGWRGYAVESLSSKFNYFYATLIFGILWSLWHVPLFLIEQTYQYDILQLSPIYAINFVISVLPLAFIISWICKKNSGSILAAILFHFIVNITQELFMVDPATKCFQTIVLTIFAIIIVYFKRDMFFDAQYKV